MPGLDDSVEVFLDQSTDFVELFRADTLTYARGQVTSRIEVRKVG